MMATLPKFVLLWTDAVLYLLWALLLWYGLHVRRDPLKRALWIKVFRSPAALCSALVVGLFALVTVADSIHFRRALPAPVGAAAGAATFYSSNTESVLDALMSRQIAMREAEYSAPLDTYGHHLNSVERDGQTVREHPRLQHGGAHLKNPETQWQGDMLQRTGLGLLAGLVVAGMAGAGLAWRLRHAHGGFTAAVRALAAGETELPWRAGWLTLLVLALLIGPACFLMNHYHVLGTDRTGNDVLLQTLKSIRTAFVIGTLSTVATLPLAVGLGLVAGYFRGWVDEAVQYLYTLLSSVPNVLLIAACVLMMQVYLDKHPEAFETGVERSDVKIFLLCVILGLTGWATLCRLVRAETMKLRELEYVQAATAFGVSDLRILVRHILPNVMHLVLITTVLSFSDLILYEAVLTYVGVGVDPGMNSFGGMINLARSEMSRQPVVWWSFVAAFSFMLALVLAANLFADGVRDAFDPRARSFRVRLAKRRGAAT
jgi:peptide/nickel transport system permease protein